ncbi:MAG: hypothetical protein WCP16_25825 [Pseudanabaena sp. ELA645]|jgi:hypothetical protein
MKKVLGSLVSILACLPILSNYPESAFAGGSDTPTVSGDTSTPSPISPNPASSIIPNSTSGTVNPTALIQTGTNNYANVNSQSTGTLNYPSCNGTCGFGIVRSSPSNGNNGNSGNQYEAVLGFIHSFNSPDQTNADTNRLMIEIQKYKTEQEVIIALSSQLADAIETGKYQRANIIAIVLAPKLGKTHIQLLAEISANR